MSPRLKTTIAVVVIVIWALSFVTGSLTKNYTPFLAVTSLMGIIVGAAFGYKWGPSNEPKND